MSYFTEGNKINEKLRSNDLILDSLITGVVVIDAENHIIVDVNEAAAKMVGSSKKDIIGNLCHKFICPAEINHCPLSHPGQVLNKSERIIIDSEGRSIPIFKSVKKVEVDNKLYFIENLIKI